MSYAEFEKGNHPAVIGVDLGAGDRAVVYQYHFDSGGNYSAKEITAAEFYKPLAPSPQAEQPAPKFAIGARVWAEPWGDGVVIGHHWSDAWKAFLYHCRMERKTTWFDGNTIQLAPSAAKVDAETKP
jgi:hypothetical protein